MSDWVNNKRTSLVFSWVVTFSWVVAFSWVGGRRVEDAGIWTWSWSWFDDLGKNNASYQTKSSNGAEKKPCLLELIGMRCYRSKSFYHRGCPVAADLWANTFGVRVLTASRFSISILLIEEKQTALHCLRSKRNNLFICLHLPNNICW